MAVSVRRADLDSDSREMVDTLQRNLPDLPHQRLFEWLYCRNPEGQALAWIASDPESTQIIGVAAAFPRRAYCFGEEIRGYVLGDFCIASGHRSLGLALTLQKACLEGLSSAGFVFDFPSDNMLAVYKRLGITAAESLVRHAKPLRADRKIAERVPVRSLALGLSAVANAGLRWRDHNRRPDGTWRIVAEDGPWGEEFTQAGREWSPKIGICVARTADYLNWRYRAHPQQQYEMLTAREGAKLQGYLVQHIDGEDCMIDDLIADEDAVRGALLARAIAIARERGVHTLSAPWLSSNPGRQVLEYYGFQPRESRPVILLSRPATKREPPQTNGGWYLSHGDWES